MIKLAPFPPSIGYSKSSVTHIKKTLKASEQDREDVKKKREDWKDFQGDTSAQRLIFIDETGAKTNMTRLYGRSPGNTRCYDHAPDGRWERLTILSAIKVTGETASLVFEGALDTLMFNAYVEKVLAPILKPGDIVVMDNLNVHKSKNAKTAIMAAGAKCIFLPQYSPDLNPIEKMWSKIKAILRSVKARTNEELEKAIAFALDCVTQSDAEGWFESCGYFVKN